MVRSCYSTIARFYDGDTTTDPIAWQFTRPDAPFLPVVSCINSLNWVERRGLTDEGFAGEVPLAPRPYSKGNRDVSLGSAAYCGTDDDWLGLGTRPSTPIPRNAFGQPACCVDFDFGVNAHCHVEFNVAYENLIFPVLPMGAFFTDSGAYNAIYGFWNAAPAYYPYFVDLYYDTDPTKDPGFKDFYLNCEFPGYATQQVYPGPANYDITYGAGQYIDNVLSWYQDGPAAFTPKMVIKGIVLWDSAGEVMAVAELAAYTSFGLAGDQLGLLVRAYCLED